jgi:hypothetical protein
MLTHWNIEVLVDGVCKVSTGDTTLSRTLERGIQQATYYQAIYPTSTVMLDKIEEACASCHTTARTPDDRGIIHRIHGRSIRCPACKGGGAKGLLDPITFRLSDDTSKIRLVQTNP